MSALSQSLVDSPTALDPFGFDAETRTERRARILAENDIDLVWQLRNIREHLGISQKELAERMGISQPTLAAFESQGNDPKLSTVRRYALALGVIVDHGVHLDLPVDQGQQWGSSQVVHLPGRIAERAVARAGWHEA